MARNRDMQSDRKRIQKFKSSRGVGSRRQNPTGYVPSAGSPSLDELRREKKLT